MRRLIAILIAIPIAILLPAIARAQIYRCEGANGVIEYSNSAGSGRDRNCKPVDLPTITTIPAPKAPRASISAPKATPEGFPRVEAASQKARDSDRRRILDDELRKEEMTLAGLRKEYNNGEPERRGDERNYQKYLDRVQKLKEDVERSEANVASLKRELSLIRE